MNLCKGTFILVVIAVLAAPVVGVRAAESGGSRALPTGRSKSRGSWGGGDGRRAVHSWTLDVRRESDNRISGRVELPDSPLGAAGNVEGRIDGKAVSGRIVDDAGRLIARFEGSITATGIEGVYRDRTGEAGRWAWEGTLR